MKHVTVQVPLDHRMSSNETVDGKPNLFRLVRRHAESFHKNADVGGGCALGSGKYDMEFELPDAEAAQLVAFAKKHGLEPMSYDLDQDDFIFIDPPTGHEN